MDKNSNTKSGASSKQDKIKRKELKAAFDSATSGEEMGTALENMQESGLFEDMSFGFETWKLAQFSDPANKNSLKMLSFAGSSSSQRNNIKLRKAFYSAKSADEMLKAFKKMESRFKEKDLGYDCWRLTQKLFAERVDPEKILSYGKRGLKHSVDRYNANHDESSLMMITDLLQMLGCSCCKLKRFEESLIYLKWSKRNLSKLESDNCFSPEFIFSSLAATHFRSAIVKTALGRGEEAVIHVRKIIEMQEKLKAVEGSSYTRFVRIDQVIAHVVEELQGLGLGEKDEVDEAVRLLKEVKESASSEDSPEKSLKCGV